jgi:hypothetical protein
VPVLAVQLARRHSLRKGARLEGLNDVHRMGLVEGLDHLDAKAVVRAEKHREVDGASSSEPLLGSHEGPRPPAPWGVIGSGATAFGVGYCAEICQEGHAQTWPRATTAAVVGAESVDEWKQWRWPLRLSSCVSGWTGGLQTREPQLALTHSDSKVR